MERLPPLTYFQDGFGRRMTQEISGDMESVKYDGDAGIDVRADRVSNRHGSRHRALWMSCVLVLVVAIGSFLAGRSTVNQVDSSASLAPGDLTMTVERSSVGRVLTLNVTAVRPTTPLAVNNLAGVVTRAPARVLVEQGTVVYAVAGRPVRAIQGGFPFYRDMTLGARGQDVAQLRSALVHLGYLTSPGMTFDQETYTALQEWQRALGVSANGVAELGELIAVPAVPTTLQLDGTVAAPGKMLSGGETVVSGPRGAPRFTLVVSQEQAQLIPESATISLEYRSARWRARITQAQAQENGDTTLVLAAPGGGPVCGNDCDLLPAGGTTSILSEVTVVPETDGPAVPIAAISTAADGRTFVRIVDSDGTRATRAVEVLASMNGMAVVTGVDEGERVLVLAGAGASSPDMDPDAGAAPSDGSSA